MSTPAAEVPAAAAAAPAVAVGLHGVVVALDPELEDWLEYVERLTYYFAANDITSEAKKKAILLNAVHLPANQDARITIESDGPLARGYRRQSPKPSPRGSSSTRGCRGKASRLRTM